MVFIFSKYQYIGNRLFRRELGDLLLAYCGNLRQLTLPNILHSSSSFERGDPQMMFTYLQI
ncbi:hypothetical protein [Nostoc commune]|uniref:hypothetical protein n=1 Tax=Nostoc commune TaxID=1178 RepID=UPI0018C79E54|nr:hypothetical protein [Nostoc commune]MBG1258275.1 hypothetical protein [Nostoc commune BAE]